MGRRKQKVRWTSVEEAFFESQGADDSDVIGGGIAMVVDAPQTDVDFDSDGRMANSRVGGDQHSETSSVSQRHYSG